MCTLTLDIDVVFQLVGSATKSIPGTAYGVLLGARSSETETRASEFLQVSRLGDNTAPLQSTLRALCGDSDPVAYFVTVPDHLYLRDDTFQNTCKNCVRNLVEGNCVVDFVFLLTLDPYMLEFGILDFKAFTLDAETKEFVEASVEISSDSYEMKQLLTLLRDTPGAEFLVKSPLPNCNALTETLETYKKLMQEHSNKIIKKALQDKLNVLRKVKDSILAFLGQ
ncbi:hypothetical protein GL50803_0011034 [Giardia duodenalis]|uniref:Uncharacterized protein n=1 Tax=Giardia intestinalis (strain ATCC 50803 / WB clone C6) TaxID=184922 RepID=A8B2V7_GIAIC|nr:hypothetical protein GL50803_0011034 [Giardia intestinalis]KAE8303052.1 hypothetical protein GL50803_0011034 [Giardia intestinalis]|eukprot:XP_001710061.1 Hypothetical protein GL50803_11034 [Giardia lamblia ATCC 50803]